MSLSEENKDGLLGTHLTWEDVQADLFEIFGPEAVLGNEKTIKDIADGRGFVSRIGVVENPWENPSIAEEQKWPTKFAIKMVTMLQHHKYPTQKEEDETKTREQEDFYRKIHNVELMIYDKLKNEKGLLKIYKSVPFTDENKSKGYLIMEYTENVEKLGIDAEFSEDLMHQVLKSLARFHASTPKFSNEERDKLKLAIYSEVFEKYNDPKIVLPTLEKLASFIPTESIEKLKNAHERFMEKEHSDFLDNMAEHLGMDRILCHGDLWTGNTLFVKEGEEDIRLKALIDFQICHFGCVGHDLARFLCCVISSNENEEKLISSYFSYLKDFWPQGEPLPFSEEQVLKAYRGYKPFTSFIAAIGIGIAATGAQKTDVPEKVWNKIIEKIIHLAAETDYVV